MKRTHIFLQLIANLVIGILVLLFIKRYMIYGNITIDIGSWGVFYTVFGVLYAIIIGFILIATLDKFDNLKRSIDSEVNEIQNVRVLLKYFSDSQKEVINNVRKALLIYVNSIHSIQWDKMVEKVSLPEFSSKLENVIESVSHLKSEDENDSYCININY